MKFEIVFEKKVTSHYYQIIEADTLEDAQKKSNKSIPQTIDEDQFTICNQEILVERISPIR